MRKRQQVAQAHEGFTLLEVLVSMVILSIAVTAIMVYMVNVQRTAWKTNKINIANQLAVSGLEAAKSKINNIDSLVKILKGIDNAVDSCYRDSSDDTVKGTVFQGTTSYSFVSPGVKLMKLRAAVAWDSVHSHYLNTVYPFKEN